MPKTLNITVPRLGRNRHGVFFVRSPSYVDEQGRRRVVQQSLKTKNPAQAKILALKYCLQLAEGESMNQNDSSDKKNIYSVNIDTGEFSANGPEDHQLMMGFLRENGEFLRNLPKKSFAQSTVQAQHVAAVPVADHGKPLRELVNLHLQKEAATVESKQTVREKQVTLEEFMEVFGENAGIRSITTQDISMRWVPVELKRPNKKYKGETLSRARLEKRRGYLAKFFSWAKTSNFYLSDNPMALKMFTKAEIRAEANPYAEFTYDDLKMLFTASYVVNMEKPDWYWPPLMALFSGARLSEVANLEIHTIKEIEGVKTYEILDGKTPDSERVVPIHPQLIDLGFWDYVQSLRAQKQKYLFPDRSSRKAVAKSTGRIWGLWIDKCGIDDKRKVFHSFRSTAITDLHNASAGAAAIRKAVGHSSPEVEGAHGRYIRGNLLRALTDAINTLSYPVIDFKELKLADPTFAAHFEKMKAEVTSPKALAKKNSLAAHQAAKAVREARSRR